MNSSEGVNRPKPKLRKDSLNTVLICDWVPKKQEDLEIEVDSGQSPMSSIQSAMSSLSCRANWVSQPTKAGSRRYALPRESETVSGRLG